MSAPADIKVLAVDDNDANLKLARILLEDLGLTVTTAESGERAVALASAEYFDLILMDVQMPGMDGHEAARRLRRIESEGRRTPIIALTAHLLPQERAALRESGFDGEIVKPISDGQIREHLARWLEHAATAPTGAATPIDAPRPSARDRVVDWELGYRLAHGNRALAEEMMNLLLTTLPRDAAAILRAWEQQDLPRLKAAVHRLNGAIRYCGVPRLQRSVAQLESALKQADSNAIATAMHHFTQATEDLCTWGEFCKQQHPAAG